MGGRLGFSFCTVYQFKQLIKGPPCIYDILSNINSYQYCLYIADTNYSSLFLKFYHSCPAFCPIYHYLLYGSSHFLSSCFTFWNCCCLGQHFSNLLSQCCPSSFLWTIDLSFEPLISLMQQCFLSRQGAVLRSQARVISLLSKDLLARGAENEPGTFHFSSALILSYDQMLFHVHQTTPSSSFFRLLLFSFFLSLAFIPPTLIYLKSLWLYSLTMLMIICQACL